MSGICDTCRKDPCSQSADGVEFCVFHESSESNYVRLFGTPERAARTLTNVCQFTHGGELWGKCSECAKAMGAYADSLCDPLKQRIAELEEQRDVLLRCLENDYGIRASWDGLRRVWVTESVTAELYYIEDKSRWSQLFGTPERVVQAIANAQKVCPSTKPCYPDCPFGSAPTCLGKTGPGDYDALLEWLKGETNGTA